jgi:hypothetical protein
MSGFVNLYHEVKNKGLRLLVIGESSANGDYEYGKGHVFVRSFERFPQITSPTDINIVVFQQEPTDELRRAAMDTTRGVEGSKVYNVYEEEIPE